MKDSFIKQSKLDRMKECGELTQDIGCFLLALPCFQDYGPFLDLRSGQNKALIAYYFPKWAELLNKAIQAGYYLKAKNGAAVFLEARFFADNKATHHYWRSEELNAFGIGFFINAELIISDSQENGGPLPQFLTLWEKGFNFGAYSKGTVKKEKAEGDKYAKPIQNPAIQWLSGLPLLINNGNGNSNENGESGIKESRIDNLESGIEELRIEESLIDNEPNKANVSPCSYPSPNGIGGIDDEKSLFEEEEPSTAKPIAIDQTLPKPILFQHEWKMAIFQRDKAKQARLIDTFERYPQETKEEVKGYLTEGEWEELNDSMPF